MPIDDLFGEFPSEGSHDSYKKQSDNLARRRKRKKSQDVQNEVGVAPDPTPEMLERREKYKNDFISLHMELFPESTGQKPFGETQKKSILFGQDIFHKGGRLLKLEPRGFAKTTRITNESLAAVLLGLQEYIVILCSNQEKAVEILDSLKTEIYSNEQLFELFPGTMACFRHLDDVPQKARYQTYNGERTYIHWGSKRIVFPWVPGEISSGKCIEIRPLSNTKGLHRKVKAGPDQGKVYRPTLYIFDDPQTSNEARSPTEVQRIITQVNRDALQGGSHSRKAGAIMAITPMCPGDVAWHFEQNEHSWDIIKYKMMEKFPINHQWWIQDYANVLLNYDRTVRGDRIRAALEAKKLVEDNYEMAHEGSEATWEHAYGWAENPQLEISAVQHAYNIILYNGTELFEYEYQCNTEYGKDDGGEVLHATPSQIMRKMLPYPRGHVPQDTKAIVSHIDVNKDILTYVTLSSASPLEPHVVDYGTLPEQYGQFSKRNIAVPLRSLFPSTSDYREVLYFAVKQLIEHLATRQYTRSDGVRMTHDVIGVDVGYEENYITRAIIESPFRSLVTPCRGRGIGPDDDLLHDKPPASVKVVYENCYELPNKRRTLDYLHYDANFFKTEVHRGFNLPAGMKGALTLFGQDRKGSPLPEEFHKVVADHCNIETPERLIGDKTGRTRVVWKEKVHQADNEYFDNIVNCYALLRKLGIELQIDPSGVAAKTQVSDMSSFLNQQKNRKLL